MYISKEIFVLDFQREGIEILSVTIILVVAVFRSGCYIPTTRNNTINAHLGSDPNSNSTNQGPNAFLPSLHRQKYQRNMLRSKLPVAASKTCGSDAFPIKQVVNVEICASQLVLVKFHSIELRNACWLFLSLTPLQIWLSCMRA